MTKITFILVLLHFVLYHPVGEHKRKLEVTNIGFRYHERAEQTSNWLP